MAIYRPILRWSADDVFEAHRVYGINPNPLYKQGMTRAGCMPCVNCPKDQIAKRFPEYIERIAKWERLVSCVRRPGTPASFFHQSTQGQSGAGTDIHAVVEWSWTTRGGRQFDLLADADPVPACSSVYGLCE
jgi:3'-phosphoadenosine 5'-phosphosulfate sulfotransferase (PAPS reductase)/FAD synthetase